MFCSFFFAYDILLGEVHLLEGVETVRNFLEKTSARYYFITVAIITAICLIETPTFRRAVIYSPGMGWRLVILAVSVAFAYVMGSKNISKVKWLYPVSIAAFVYLVPPAIDLMHRYPDSFGYYMMYNILLGFPLFLIHLIIAMIGMIIGLRIWKSRN